MTDADYQDDPTILDEHILWRRIRPGWWHYDDNLGRYRPNSDSFKDSNDGSPMSVFLSEVALAAGQDAQSCLIGHGGYGLVFMTARDVRAAGMGISRAPKPGEEAHAFVFGKKTKGKSTMMARASDWLIEPESW